MKQALVIFASGGGTGAANLIQKLPHINIVVVSNHENSGVKRRADFLRVPFYYFPGPYTEKGYHELIQEISENMNVDESDLWYALSGWFKKVQGLPPARTFNIHPAPLPRFGGKGVYGEKLHEMVWKAYEKGEITEGEIVMHFVTEKIDEGPIFFRHSFSLYGIENLEDYRENVRALEHYFQPALTNLVIEGEISWDGHDPKTLCT